MEKLCTLAEHTGKPVEKCGNGFDQSGEQGALKETNDHFKRRDEPSNVWEDARQSVLVTFQPAKSLFAISPLQLLLARLYHYS